MQRQILINVMIFFAYALNLPLNTQRPITAHNALENLAWILAHGSRPIYRAPTYIAVPFHGPHQPRYIGLTLYKGFLLYLSRVAGMLSRACVFINKNIHILIRTSLKFVPNGLINNKSVLVLFFSFFFVLIIAWHWTGDKPLPESIMAYLLTYICSASINPFHSMILP